MAARAYDSAAFFLKGASAILNFPDLVDSLPRPLSSSRRDIQSAAAMAALHHPTGDDSTTTSFQDVLEAPLMSPPSALIPLSETFHGTKSLITFSSWNQQ
ncbi:dehydration-responsive element-binding protein 3 [Cajanus cajan]|uniref:Dehydration-responsive element-binding protein 3 n=1 Tax=Cajanus cajan TaxID=3821 RepID=A0A151TP03_CAJCA|nr:dehydration-responsive element-binding protein 3 [Cajanus cajan]KYP68778.1 Dehydration-responsive element-binding protein 3 [Cajanus cajan]